MTSTTGVQSLGGAGFRRCFLVLFTIGCGASLTTASGGTGGAGGSTGGGPTAAGRDAALNLGFPGIPVCVGCSLCGNEVVDPGEACDDGNGSAATAAAPSVRSSAVGPVQCPASPASAWSLAAMACWRRRRAATTATRRTGTVARAVAQSKQAGAAPSPEAAVRRSAATG